MNLKVIGCSIQGYSHKIHKPEPLPCQDAFDKEVIIEGTTMAVAVADGHGSSTCLYSADGAMLSARIFCEKMAELFQRYENDYAQLWAFLHRDGSMQIAQEIVETWRKRVIEKHIELGRIIPEQKDKDQTNDWPLWKDIYHLYGTTLVGLFITPEFHYALQIGDGDITSIENGHASVVIDGDQILGVETHSLCEQTPWKHAHSKLMHVNDETRFAYILSSDGFKNSHASLQEYFTSCKEYVETIRQNNPNEVEKALPEWLEETSKFGCGDDITVVIVYSVDASCGAENMLIEMPEEKEIIDVEEDKNSPQANASEYSIPTDNSSIQGGSLGKTQIELEQEHMIIPSQRETNADSLMKASDECLPVESLEACAMNMSNFATEQTHDITSNENNEKSEKEENTHIESDSTEQCDSQQTRQNSTETIRKVSSSDILSSYEHLKKYHLEKEELEPLPILQPEQIKVTLCNDEQQKGEMLGR